MNKKAKILVLSLAIVGSISIGAAAFVQYNNYVHSSQTNSGSKTDETYVVRFVDNTNTVRKEVSSTDKLSLVDAPYLYRDNTAQIWRTDDGKCLNDIDNVTEPLVFKPYDVTQSDNLIINDDIDLRENTLNASTVLNSAHTKIYETPEAKYVINGVHNVEFWAGENYNEATTSFKAEATDHSNPICNNYRGSGYGKGDALDNYAGLQYLPEKKDGKNIDETGREVTGTTAFYKTKVSGNNRTKPRYSTNYCFTQIRITRDIYLTSSLTLGGATGFGARTSDGNMPQINFQGAIVGPYSELDLQGHDLYVANGAMIDCWGSITDTVGGGRIILDTGSTMYTPCVIEDMFREDSMPTSYINNTGPFGMFRCPYINATIEIRPGANFYGKYLITFKSQGTITGDFHLVGSEDNCLFQFPNNNDNQGAKIIREVSYLELTPEQKQNFIKDDSDENNTWQKIKYTFENCGEVNFKGINFSVDIDIVNMNMRSKKYQLFVPPYFDFELQNSKITIDQELVFMPGCNAIIDQNSTVELTTSGSTNLTLGKNSVGWNTVVNDEQTFNSAGGITFLPYFRTMAENSFWVDGKNAYNPILDVDKYSSSENSWGQNIYTSCDAFWDYLATIDSGCEFNGTLLLDNNKPNNIKHDYVIAGNINFDDPSAQLQGIQNKARFYTSAAYLGPCRLVLLVPVFGPLKRRFNTLQITTVPLISKGKVLTSMDNQTQINVDSTYTYDKKLRVIKTSETNGYSWIFKNYDSNTALKNVYKAHNINDTDSLLNGAWRQVTINTAKHTVTYNSKEFADYLGVKLPVNNFDSSNNSIVYVKANLLKGENNEHDVSNYKMKYNSTRGIWEWSA